MPIDPRAPVPITPEARAAHRAGELERQVAELKTSPPFVSVGSGAPTADPTLLTEGTRYLDRTNRRAYYVLGDGASAATNVWRYAALT